MSTRIQNGFEQFRIQIYQGLSEARIREMKETLGIMMDNVTFLSEPLKKEQGRPENPNQPVHGDKRR